MTWRPFELHTHTFHSDGQQSVKELVEHSKKLGFQGVALTDHNTISGFSELDILDEGDMAIIKGMEWTTFDGHVLLLGINEYMDWRSLTRDNLAEHLEEAKRKGAIVGVAHPFRMGDPANTGCHFTFAFDQWHLVDYIEVWSLTNPSNRVENTRAFALWTERLNQGLKISAVSGRDWHGGEEKEAYLAATYFPDYGVEWAYQHYVKKATVSIGPVLSLTVTNDEGEVFHIGDEIKSNKNRGMVECSLEQGKIQSNYPIRGEYRLIIDSNEGIVVESKLGMDETRKMTVRLNQLQWMRARIEDQQGIVAFTNPIYVGRRA